MIHGYLEMIWYLLRLARASPRSPSALHRLRRLCSAATGASHPEEGPEEEISEHLQRQILQAGLHFLRGDVDKLRANVINRGATADVDKLVRYIISRLPYCDCYSI